MRTYHWMSPSAAAASLALALGGCAGSSTAPEFEAAGSPQAAVSGTVATVTVYPATYTLQLGEVKQLIAIPRDASGTTLSGYVPLWSSSNPGVASVSSTGVVTAKAGGTVTISATIAGLTGSAVITVNAPLPVASIDLDPTSLSVVKGSYGQLTALPLDASGNPLSGYTMTWTSSNSAVAKVYSNGLVQGLALGTATITASAGGKSATSAVTITGSTTTSSTGNTVTVYPATYTLKKGTAKQLVAIARDPSGNVISGAVFQWSSSNTSVATVSSSGFVTARAAGKAVIKATWSGIIGKSTINVTL